MENFCAASLSPLQFRGSGKVKLISKWQFPTFPVRSLGTLLSHFRLPAIFGKAIAREKDIKILPRTHFNKELSTHEKKDPGGSLGLNAYNADDDIVILWANFEARIASYRPAWLASFPKKKIGPGS